MEPIDLRKITTLLNYERTTSDPRYKGARLLRSSVVEPKIIQHLTSMEGNHALRETIDQAPASIENTIFSLFAYDSEPENTSEFPATTCEIHPEASEEVKALTFAQRESIYHGAHGHDGCYAAIALYQIFLDRCEPGQKLSIQLPKEPPQLVDAEQRFIVELKMTDPKLLTIISGNGETMITGCRKEEPHSIVAFGTKHAYPDLMVDMSRLQYGDSGRGAFGENYYLGHLLKYIDSFDEICRNIVAVKSGSPRIRLPEDEAQRKWLEGCADRAWKRWEEKDTKPWCEFCGRGGNLRKCSSCKDVKVWYCCQEHQRAGWKLHKLTCEKKA